MSFCLLTKSHRCIATTLRLMINSEEVLYKPNENSIYIYIYFNAAAACNAFKL